MVLSLPSLPFCRNNIKDILDIPIPLFRNLPIFTVVLVDTFGYCKQAYNMQ